MKKKRFFTSKAGTAVLAAAAIVLLAFASITGARAALTYFSETYTSRVEMYDIGVSLLENGERVSWRDYKSNSDGEWDEATGALLANMLGEGESVIPGKAYPEEISVRNSGTINQFVRVTLYQYWLDADGNKMQDLSPALIDLNLINTGTEWLLDEDAAENSSPERTVLYLSHLLDAGETTLPLSDTLTIDGMIATKVTQEKTTEGNYTTIKTTYDYDGVKFVLEARVDAVQEHNAQDAVKSAWGRDVSISGETLSLR